MKLCMMAVAINQQHHELKSFVRPPRCRLQSYSNFDQIMLDFAQSNLSHSFKHAFELTNLHRSSSSPCLSRAREDSDTNPRIEIVGGHGAPKVRALVVEVAIAMASGFHIEPVSSGLGGAYFVHARTGVTIAVVKPIDEEPLAFNNPKGFAGRMLGQPGMKPSIRVGETGIRELAAYLLDHDSFAGVPPTALVKISHVLFHVNSSEPTITAPPCKIASLQRFVAHDSDAGDLGPSGFSVSSVHRIGILDVRILNLDRHSGNLLVKHGQEGYAVGAAELVPIDHGLCLPEALDDPYFEWLHWPQASIPFSESELEYISNLDPYKDVEILRTRIPSIRESSLRVLVVCTIFLKRATKAGFCLAEIGEMMTREFRGGEESMSVLENLCLTAKAGVGTTKIDDDSDHGNKDIKHFQSDSECEDDSNQVSYIPQLLETTTRLGKPPRIPSYSSERLISKFHNLMLPPRLLGSPYLSALDPNMADEELKTEVITCPLPVTESGKEDPAIVSKDEAESETHRKSKRRKNCPSALEKCSFTFDTNSQNWVQFTPKFGSFNMLVEHQPQPSRVERKQEAASTAAAAAHSKTNNSVDIERCQK